MQTFLTKLRHDPAAFLLPLLFFVLPFERIPSVDVASITLRLSLFVGLALILVASWKVVASRQLTITRLRLPILFLSLFMLWNLALIPFAVNHTRALEVVVFTAFTMLVGLSVATLFRQEHLDSIVRWLVAGTAIVVAWGLYQYFGNILGVSNSLTGLSDRYSWELFGFPRIQGPALEPLYFAAYLLLPISILSAYFLDYRQKTGWKQPLLLLLATTCLFLTVSRGGYAAFIVLALSLLTIGIARRTARIRQIVLYLILIACAFGLSFLLISKINKPASLSAKKATGSHSYTRQISDTGLEGPGDERAHSRAKALEIFKAHPITGVGPGNFGPFIQPSAKGGWTIVNNEPLELAAETGVVGLALFLAFVLSLFGGAVRYLFSKASRHRTLMGGLVAYLVALAVQYQTYSTLYIMQVWVVLGLIMGLLLTRFRAGD